MGIYASVSVGRHNDNRFKLSEDDILEIKRLYQELDYSQNSLASMFKVSRATISYYVDPVANAKQRAKNAKRKRNKDQERIQYLTNKIRRRNLVRTFVRQYTKMQMRAQRAKDPEHARELSRKSQAKFRANNPERSKETQKRYWHRHHCKCHKHKDQ